MIRQLKIGIIILAALSFIGVAVWMGIRDRLAFEPMTQPFTFERDVRQDKGIELKVDPVSKEGVKLSEVFSKDRMESYGAEGHLPEGVGLNVTFVWKKGEKEIQTKQFSIPGWETYEPESTSARREFVSQKKGEFDKLADEFRAAVPIKFIFAVVVDTTEGVDGRLMRQVHDGSDETIGVLAEYNKATVYLYNLSDLAYQGDRRKIQPQTVTELGNSVDSFLSGRKPENKSSILRGLRKVIEDLNAVRGDEPAQVDIWTDGLENTEDVSVYHDRSLLDEANWDRLDGVWNPERLNLDGLTIRLHPLPPPPGNRNYEKQQDRGLEYLQNRLQSMEVLMNDTKADAGTAHPSATPMLLLQSEGMKGDRVPTVRELDRDRNKF